ncbi:MAG: RimJ/RimL family protein N-acetyltransferase [Candidatus Azotimanducaceae bacterium]|jgi:RimJ/RimL family protein N-acetyltransferase
MLIKEYSRAMNAINFPERIPFNNYLDSESLQVVRADALPITEIVRTQVASICNQPLIYKTLFREAFGDVPYTEKNAQEFFEWAHEGWRSNSHFVFLLVNEHGHIVGALDIKSADFAAAEVGYWASAEYPGNVTNALVAMLDAATLVGFARFTAYVSKVNAKSTRVLERAGFTFAIANKKQQGFVFLEHVRE